MSNVVQIHDIIQLDDGLPVMVMDLLEGESLGERLAREGSIALPDLARFLVPVISAVGTAHSLGIVHRDLKPDNIFLCTLPDGRIESKVLDFGIAKLSSFEGDAAQTSALTRTGSMLGTPYYMAPEQAFGEKDVDHRADVWALGVILYECLTGTRPVDGDNFGQLLKVIAMGSIQPFSAIAPDMPEDVKTLVDRMLTADRARRSQGLEEAYAVLSRYTSASAASFPPPGTSPIFEGPTSRASTPLAITPRGGGPNTLDPTAPTIIAAPSSGRARWLFGAVAALALAGGGMVVAFRSGTHVAAEPSPTALSVQPEAAVLPSASASSVILVVPVPASAASATPSVSAKSPEVKPVGGKPASPARPGSRPGAEKPPDATPTPPPKPAKLPGSIPESAPF
jgi:eukaryotic-like serine/threonine-protein kinase